MNESEFPSNSKVNPINQRPVKNVEDKKLEKIVTGEVIQRKKSFGTRFKETFTVEDTKSVVSSIWFDVLIPGAKDMVFDAFSQGLERKLFGTARSGSRRGGYRPGGSLFGNASYMPYNRYSASSPQREDPRGRPQAPSRQPRGGHDLGELILQTRVEGQAVLDQMYELLSVYGMASVADLYSLLGHSSEFTDMNWGWTDLQGSDVVKIPEGYLLQLPRPAPIASS